MFIALTPDVSVAPQISASDCPLAAAQGFAVIINNRPDGEAAGQPTSAEIHAAASAAGLRYVNIPVDGTGLTMEKVREMAAALDEGGPALAFCRSGTRSTNLWALAEASRGGDPDAIIKAAELVGYDVSGMLPTLRRLAGKD